MTAPTESNGRGRWRELARDLVLVGAASGLFYTGIQWGVAQQSLLAVERTLTQHQTESQAMYVEQSRLAAHVLVLEAEMLDVRRRLDELERRRRP